MMNRTLVTSGVLGAAAALAAAGCGGGGNKQLTKAEYADKVDNLCAAAQAKGKSLDLSSLSKIARSGTEAKGILNELANKVDNLEPPDEVSDSAKSFVDGLKQEANEIGELSQAAKNADVAKIQEIQGKLQSQIAATSEDARFIGATGCARLFAS
jgi:hypothetical protein